LNVYVNSRLWPNEHLSVANCLAVRKALKPKLQGGDSWYPMVIAYDYLRHPHEASVYERVFFQDRLKLQYPPSAMLVSAAFYSIWPAPLDSAHEAQL